MHTISIILIQNTLLIVMLGMLLLTAIVRIVRYVLDILP